MISRRILDIFDRERPIEFFEFGRVKIDGKEFDHDILVHEGQVKEWQRKNRHLVTNQDLEWLIKKKPKEILIGTGTEGRLEVDVNLPIPVRLFKSEEAVSFFNNHPQSALALHITC